MHTQNQFCSMAIMIILLYLFLRQKRVGLYTEKVFLRTLLVAMLCVSGYTLAWCKSLQSRYPCTFS